MVTKHSEGKWYRPYLQRVGGTYLEKARWALSLVDKPGGWNGLTPGQRQDLLNEIGVFCADPETNLAGAFVILGTDALDAGPPPEGEARKILEMFDAMLWAAIRHEPIPFTPRGGSQTLRWEEDMGRYGLLRERHPWKGWMEAARCELECMIYECGHLLRLCPAPALRAKSGETCDVRFVASRPNQAYCSARCQTRAATRAYRSGDSTPVAKIQAAKERAARKQKKEG